MTFSNESELTEKIYQYIHDDNFDAALQLLHDAYKKGPNQNNWTISCDEINPAAYLKNFIEISQEKQSPLPLILGFHLLSGYRSNHKLFDPCIRLMIKNIYSILVNDKTFLDLILRALQQQDRNLQVSFYHELLIKCFQQNNIDILKHLNTLEEPFNLSKNIQSLTLYQLNLVTHYVSSEKFDYIFTTHLLSTIDDKNLQLDFCKKIIQQAFVSNNAPLINELSIKTELSVFVTVVQELSSQKKLEMLYHPLSVNPTIDTQVTQAILESLDAKARESLINSLIREQMNNAPLIQTILKSLNAQEKKSLITHLCSERPTNISSVQKILELFDSDEIKEEFYTNLVLESFDTYNISFLKALSLFKEPYNFNTATKDVDQTKLKRFLALDEPKATYISKKMKSFFKKYHQIEYQDALLSLAQRGNRKNYHFEPVLLKPDELKDFLEVLSHAHKPIEQQFICANYHFVSGKIHIDAEGHAKLFLIDSLGIQEPNLFYYDELLVDFSETFPQHEIFVSKETRQNDNKSCSVFALDDTAHLANLRIEGEHQNIWAYLSSQKKSEQQVAIPSEKRRKSVTVYAVPLPLSLTRTMQSRKLLNATVPGRPEKDQQFLINKKGQTTHESAEPFFKPNQKEGKVQNNRIEYKLSRMQEQNFDFLEQHSEEYVEKTMQHFTLDAFKIRVNQNKIAPPLVTQEVETLEIKPPQETLTHIDEAFTEEPSFWRDYLIPLFNAIVSLFRAIMSCIRMRENTEAYLNHIRLNNPS